MLKTYRSRVTAFLLVQLAAISAHSLADSPPAAEQDNPIAAQYTEYKWSNGDPPVKMLAKEEGFCFLTEVGGHFAGAGEAVRVYIGQDGFWYLGGQSGQPDLWGKAMSVKFTHKVKAAMVLPPDPNAAAWTAELAKLASSADAAIKEIAVHEQAGVPDESQKLIALANQWDTTTRNLPLDERRLIETHILRLCDLALNEPAGPQRDRDEQKTDALRIALANRQLNDIAEWSPRGGTWSMTEGRIQGEGDSRLQFMPPLPADCFIEFRMSIIDGMRPRVLFPNTDLYVGNEGFQRIIDVFGVDEGRTISTSYALGDKIKVGLKFVGKSVEFYVNDELMGKCKRRYVPRQMSIILRGGDDWSPGTTQFWDFKMSPAK